jgi:hypothetical protein
MIAPRLSWSCVSGCMIACWLLGVTPGAADSMLAGTVIDAITLQPVAAADVQIEYSGQTLGAGTADLDGVYRVPFTIPAAAPAIVTMIASARSAAHGVTKSNFQVNAGNPVDAVHDIKLYPTGVTECRSLTGHSVIVGYFVPPVGRDFADLSRRVADSLRYALDSRLQTVTLKSELRPSFEPCDLAKPRTPGFGANFAKALRADAFVGGNIAVADGAPSFMVSFYVSDAYGLFSNPASASSRSLDLDNPRSDAQVAGETHAAVIAAIAAGLAGKNDCVNALAVLSVVERLVDVVPPYVKSLRADCQSRVPNAGLRRATP